VENSELTKWCVHKADNPLGEVILTQAMGLAPLGWLQFEMRVDPFEQPELAREWDRIVRQVREEIEFHTLTGDYWGKIKQEWPEAEQPAPETAEPGTSQQPAQSAGRPCGEAGWEPWFKYYYEMQEAKRKYTLKDLAKDMGYSYSYVREQKARYDAEHRRTEED